MKFASFRPQVVMLEGRLQPCSILGSPMLSDGLGIMDHALQTGFEEAAHQNTLPALTSTESGSQVSTPAQPIDNGTPIITNPLIQSTQVLQAPQVLDSQVEALQNHLLSSGKVPLQVDPPNHGGGTTTPGDITCDGNFESGLQFQNVPGGSPNSCWWGEDTSNFTSIASGGGHTGMFYASLGPVGDINAKLAEIVPTTGGTNYVLSFWLANGGGTPNYFRVSFDGVQVYDVENGPAQAYTHVTVNVTGSHEEAGLEFHSRQDPSFWNLDDISITPA
jgi:hypothetical protein